MTADPELVALLVKAERIRNPPEDVAFRRNLRLLVTDDGFGRADRIKGVVPIQSVPALSADQVVVDGVDADDLQQVLDSNAAVLSALQNASFVVIDPTGDLGNEVALSALSAGLLKIDGDGIPSTATANTDYLPVASPTVTGTLTTVNLTATGDSLLGNGGSDITLVQGHLKHKGAAPSIAVGAALGTGGSVGATITGTDQVGELVLVAGTTSLGTGTAATISFVTARPDTNYIVKIQARASSAGANAVQAYATRSTVNEWLLRFSAAPSSGLSLAYSYQVFEWSN